MFEGVLLTDVLAKVDLPLGEKFHSTGASYYIEKLGTVTNYPNSCGELCGKLNRDLQTGPPGRPPKERAAAVGTRTGRMG
jgi:hypothetical protein